MVFLPDQSGFNIGPFYRAAQRDFDRFYFGLSERNARVAGFTKLSFKRIWYWPAVLLQVIGT